MGRCSVVTMGRLGVDHIAAVEGLQGPVSIDRRCADLPELIAVCRAGRADAALIIGDTDQLTATVLHELQGEGRNVVVISHIAQERGRLQRLGVRSFPDEVSASDLALALRGVQAAEDADPGSAGPTPGLSSGFPYAAAQVHHRREHPSPEQSSPEPFLPERPSPAARRDAMADGRNAAPAETAISAETPASAGAAAARETAEAAETTQARTAAESRITAESRSTAAAVAATGTVTTTETRAAVGLGDLHGAALASGSGSAGGITVVWGAPGSPGRSTVAVNLAAELALHGSSVLLLDADTVAASLVAQLGLMEETAGLARVCRAADLGRLDVAAMHAATTVVQIGGVRLDLLSGLPRSQRWPELRERSLTAVLELVRVHYEHVIIDVAAPVEEDEELSFDTAAPQRNAATLACLRLAERLLVVGAADPVNFPRLVKAVEALDPSLGGVPGVQPEVVINKVRSEVIGRSPRDQLSQTWLRIGPDAPIAAFLPWDPAGCDAALLTGQILAEAAPNSPLRRGIARLAGVDLPVRRRGLLRSGRR
ncbi:AAA family ATPase [Nesterenkonia sandarakina]|uniref:MinD-like ATPase involved in chromosome partitioning or flagellar assembly n=1 Tax=Nesterenkonia sandarakina TaxID=272918 RepID=A0A7Z0J3R3_9MICC|nr:hypothetical protein [Nesterenkonia sandarakina]NYJ17033.1 MinD-like ATPase involved in chromosome partitioning or flagellar assembly [Nesterenkonia sandarakina]